MINLSEEAYKPLYYNLKSGLAFCSSIRDREGEPTTFHVFWNPSNIPIGRRHLLMLKSIIATQTKNSKIIFWSNVNLQDTPILAPVLPFIEFKILNLLEEFNKVPIEYRMNYDYVSNFYAGSDFIRYVLLYNYGGVWIDADIILLRNLTPFLDQEFAYKWSIIDGINGAVLHLNKGGKTALSLIKGVFETPAVHIASWSTNVLSNIYKRDKSFTVFPCTFFDPSWLNEENQFFTANTLFNDELYKGAFSVHLHNNWATTIESGCRFEKYEQLIEEKFNEVISHD